MINDIKYIKKFLEKYGFKGLSALFFIIIILLFLCTKSCINIGDFSALKWAGIKCGCSSEKIIDKTLIQNHNNNHNNIQYLKDSLSYKEKEKADLEEKMKEVNGQLVKEGITNDTLLQQRDRLEKKISDLTKEISRYKTKIYYSDSLVKISKINTKNESEINDKKFYDSISSQKKIDSLKSITSILDSVFITNLKARFIDNTNVRIDFKIKGVDVLRRNGYDKPPHIKLQIKDTSTGLYIESIEGNTNRRKYTYGSFTYDENSSNEVAGNCNFINQDKKPFNKKKNYMIEIYLESFNRPLGIIGQDFGGFKPFDTNPRTN